jgi:hypothetical protein
VVRYWAQEALTKADLDLERLAVALPTVDPATVAIRQASRWFRFFWAKGITAVAMPWGIYAHPDRLEEPAADLGRLVVHELAHIDQWRRLGMIGWSRAYLGDYLRGRRAGLGHWGAYRSIGLEEEARDVAARLGG